MNLVGSQLKFLSDVADLARLDFEAASISLVAQGKKLVSRYMGAYSSGQRWIDLEEESDLEVALSAQQFKSMVALFSDEEEVEVKTLSAGLRLQSAIKGINLTYKGEPEPIDEFDPPADGQFFEMPIASLLREVEVATEFSARSMAKPVLTGLRLAGGNGRFGVQASDGISVLYEARMDVNGDQPISMIAPGYDLVLGLKLLGSGMVKILNSEKSLQLYGDNAIFRSSTLNGTWPDFARVRQPYERQSAQIPTELIKSLVQSVRILGTSNDLRLQGDGTYLRLETIEDESGHFEAKIPSQIKGSYTYDVGAFLLAQELGSDLIVQLPNEGNVPTLIECGYRKLWIATKL